MRSRPGISLIECLVSLVVLAIGVAGASLTTQTAIRLTRVARYRQGVVRAAQTELLRFLSAPCPRRDSSWTRPSDEGFVGRWVIMLTDSTVALQGTVRDSLSPAMPAFPIEAQRRCA